MNPVGLREVERARADGGWDSAYEPQSTATVPDDLRPELERTENAREFFASLDGANGYASLTGSKTPRNPRPGHAVSRSRWRRWPSGRSPTPKKTTPARSG